jgi:hypothetical protein
MGSEAAKSDAAIRSAQKELLGYLNFSSGSSDAQFLRNLDALYRARGGAQDADDAARRVFAGLASRLDGLAREGGAFGDVAQVRHMLHLVPRFLDAYRAFHQDLLAHLADAQLWRPLMVGRACEALLVERSAGDDDDEILAAAIRRLNDYIGHRPVAVLQAQPCEPYAHEWVRPVPLYVRGVGVACGPYEKVLSIALNIIHGTDASLLDRAWFDSDHLDEIALDPRAYDFDHPVNKRPNYHFGQWDPHHIDNRGFYRRFVLQQVTLDSLLARATSSRHLDEEELMWEAAAVLAGTMLMASGTSGNGPTCHDSSVTLGTLLPHIAAYRDEFYDQLLERVSGRHGQRLAQEAQQLRQPLGGARQHLNQEIARRRAVQMQQVHLALVFARMGYPQAALRQAEEVQVPSARLVCRINCNLTASHAAIDDRRLAEVHGLFEEIEVLTHRAIECGAIIDPWNIVGFGGNFSLFPAVENSIHDYRGDELIDLMEQILGTLARAWSEAAAADDTPLEAQFSECLARWANWWDRFATSSVEGVKRLLAKDVEVSANLVAGALNAWHKAGAAAGDIRFWRMFVDQFDSPKAFQLVVEALLEQGDAVASMALIVQWVSQADRTPLEEGDASLHPLVERWLQVVHQRADQSGDDAWSQVRRLLEHLEANAEDYWRVPELELQNVSTTQPGETGLDDDQSWEEEGDELFQAAYEDVVYRDSTADGVDDELLEWGGGDAATDYELEQEAQRLQQRLAFLSTIARLWSEAAMLGLDAADADRFDLLDNWRNQARDNFERLVSLLQRVHEFKLPLPSASQQSLEEFDRRRMIKDSLLEQTIATSVEMAVSVRLLSAVVLGEVEDAPSLPMLPHSNVDTVLVHALLKQDAQMLESVWELFLSALRERCLLYVPLAHGGDPRQIVQTRAVQRLVMDLVEWLPKQGLLVETFELLQTAQVSEQSRPIRQSAVTEFDRLFDRGFRGMVDTLIRASSAAKFPRPDGPPVRQSHGPTVPRSDGPTVTPSHGTTDLTDSDRQLVEALQQLSEAMLRLWLAHSRSLRLSVVEKLLPDERWQIFVRFVKKYGSQIFTQSFLHLGNLRAILHQGVKEWLDRLCEDPDAGDDLDLVADLQAGAQVARAAKTLSVAIEAVVENYREYRDYNATTTQSDRGELLYCFIDFLRLRSEYDRVAWNLRPVVTAYEVLVRHGCDAAAETWRQALAERTAETADIHCKRHEELVAKYGMRLPSIAGRIGERFVRPLAIDRVRALIRPAIEEAAGAGRQGAHPAFDRLEQELIDLSREPNGAGLDIPDWLSALDEEVAASQSELNGDHALPQLDESDEATFQWRDVLEQLDEITDLAK